MKVNVVWMTTLSRAQSLETCAAYFSIICRLRAESLEPRKYVALFNIFQDQSRDSVLVRVSFSVNDLKRLDYTFECYFKLSQIKVHKQ